MFSAVRRARREAGKQRQQGDSGDVARQAPLTRQEPGLVVQCHRIAQQAAATAGQLGAVVAAAVTTAAAPLLELQQWQAQQAAGRRQLLLASVSGSTLDQPQKAYLPDKRRLAGAARGGGDAGGSSGGDGGPNLLVDAADNERFLISEVRAARGTGDEEHRCPAVPEARAADAQAAHARAQPMLGDAHSILSAPRVRAQIDVVGVDGELKDMALQALNARANFAYSLKEASWGGAGGGASCDWAHTAWRRRAAPWLAVLHLQVWKAQITLLTVHYTILSTRPDHGRHAPRV